MAQHKATRRQSLRSALCHRRLADQILDGLKTSQDSFNAAMDKLNADTAIALDTDYEASLAIDPTFEGDDTGTGAQHKATLRKSLRSALAHKRLADEIIDAWEEFQTAHNALMVKLDAEGGTLAATDFASTLGLEPLDPESALTPGQHKASARGSLQKALAHRSLANDLLDGIKALQDGFNSSLAALDAGTVAGGHAGFKVDPTNPDA